MQKRKMYLCNIDLLSKLLFVIVAPCAVQCGGFLRLMMRAEVEWFMRRNFLKFQTGIADVCIKDGHLMECAFLLVFPCWTNVEGPE